MDYDKQSYFRSQADKCFHEAEESADKAIKLGWLTLAEEWTLLAADGRQEVLGEIYDEPADYPALRQVYTH